MAPLSDRELIQSLSLALDGLVELVEREAAKEVRKPARGILRQITWQERLKGVNELLDAANDRLLA